MAKSFYSTPVREVFGTSTALATTLAYGDILNVRKQFKAVQFYCASDVSFLLTPRIRKVLVYDASADAYADFTTPAIDNLTTTHVNLGTMTLSDKLYVGCVDTFLGLSVNVTSVNANAATTAANYWNGGTWTALSITDGTLTATETLSQDGLYVWTIPASGYWKPISAYDITEGAVTDADQLYYVQMNPSATLTAGTTITTLISINKGTDYGYYPAAMVHDFNYDEDVVGGLQFLAIAGTPTVYANFIDYKG